MLVHYIIKNINFIFLNKKLSTCIDIILCYHCVPLLKWIVMSSAPTLIRKKLLFFCILSMLVNFSNQLSVCYAWFLQSQLIMQVYKLTEKENWNSMTLTDCQLASHRPLKEYKKYLDQRVCLTPGASFCTGKFLHDGQFVIFFSHFGKFCHIHSTTSESMLVKF